MNASLLKAGAKRGDTLIGFVVGLLVGLGLALLVAVYVTRVPVPFVDRGVTRKPADDAAEAERNKGWNPNAGLVNKAPPLPAATEAGPTPMAGDPVTESEKPVGSQPIDSATPRPEADPLGDLMKAKSGGVAEPAPPALAGADPFTYFVQVGAFRSPDEAQAQKARLAMLGMEANITEREQGGRTVFRVRMGPFGQKAMAEATREQLEVNGVEAALVRVQR